MSEVRDTPTRDVFQRERLALWRRWSLHTTQLAPSLPLYRSATPETADIVQSPILHNCHLLGSLQAVTARYPQAIAALVRPRGAGAVVHYHGPFSPPSGSCIELDRAFLRDWTGRRAFSGGACAWPAFIEKAYAATSVGCGALLRRGWPDHALSWILGCPAMLVPIDRQETPAGWLGPLLALYAQGECLVMMTAMHCHAVVGCTDDGGFILDDSLRAWPGQKRTRTLKPSTRAGTYVAYACTCGARVATEKVLHQASIC